MGAVGIFLAGFYHRKNNRNALLRGAAQKTTPKRAVTHVGGLTRGSWQEFVAGDMRSDRDYRTLRPSPDGYQREGRACVISP